MSTNTESPHILSIDNGTQSVRALLFDLQGNLVSKSKVPIEPYYSKHPGWAEQDAGYYWQSLCQACKSLWEKTDVPKDSIKAISLTTQRATMFNLDREGKPLRPGIVWLDQRRAEGLEPMGGLWGLIFRLIGEKDTLDHFRSQAEANWIKQNEPHIWKATHKFLLLSGYLTYHLTGKFVDSVGCQVGYIPFDYKHLCWASPRDWKWKAVSVEPRMLPELIKPGQPLGTITQQASDATGIPSGLPMIAAAADKACEVIGAGCMEPDIGCLSYGTTATINATNTKYIEAIRLLPPYPAAVPDTYCMEIEIHRGYWMVTWFKNEFGLREQHLAKEMGVEPESLFDDLVNQVPPGSMGLTLQPYWSPGIREPGLEAKGAIIGFGDVHTRAHIYRAILEGLAYALRDGKEQFEKRTGIPIKKIRVSGGGSQSDAAMQITADIFGLPAERPHTYETSGLGAAIDATVGLGLYPNFYEAVKHMTRVGDVFHPDIARHQLYDKLYKMVYKKMYKRLQPLYTSIREITGYPP